VDSWLLYAGARGPLRSMKQGTFYETLTLELIDNDFDSVCLRVRAGSCVPRQLMQRSGIGPHATPTKTRKRDKGGQEKPSRKSLRCMRWPNEESVLFFPRRRDRRGIYLRFVEGTGLLLVPCAYRARLTDEGIPGPGSAPIPMLINAGIDSSCRPLYYAFLFG
jgi:hypothetical protein